MEARHGWFVREFYLLIVTCELSSQPAYCGGQGITHILALLYYRWFGFDLVVGCVGGVDSDSPCVLGVLFCDGGEFIFGLGDVQVDDAIIIHI